MRFLWRQSLLFLVFITLGLWTTLAYGTSTVIAVDPARIELIVKPGVSVTGAIVITNEGTEAVRMGAEVRDWNMGIHGEPIFAPPKERKSSSAGWIRFNPRIALINPGKKQIIRYSITPPKGTPPGEYRSAVLFAAETADSGQKNLGLSGNVVTTIYANIRPIQRRGEMLSSKASFRDGVMTVRSTIRSTGNAHLRFTGTFFIFDQTEKIVGEGKYGGKTVFPGQDRELVGEWKGKLEKGAYRIQSIFRYLPAFYAEDMVEYNQAQGLKFFTELNVE